MPRTVWWSKGVGFSDERGTPVNFQRPTSPNSQSVLTYLTFPSPPLLPLNPTLPISQPHDSMTKKSSAQPALNPYTPCATLRYAALVDPRKLLG